LPTNASIFAWSSAGWLVITYLPSSLMHAAILASARAVWQAERERRVRRHARSGEMSVQPAIEFRDQTGGLIRCFQRREVAHRFQAAYSEPGMVPGK